MSEKKKKLTPWQQAISGSTAGVVARLVISPIDVIKIRLQTQANPKNTVAKYTGVVQAAKRVVAEEGWRALWKGNLSAELLYLTYGGAQFLFYDVAEKNFKQYVRQIKPGYGRFRGRTDRGCRIGRINDKFQWTWQHFCQEHLLDLVQRQQRTHST